VLHASYTFQQKWHKCRGVCFSQFAIDLSKAVQRSKADNSWSFHPQDGELAIRISFFDLFKDEIQIPLRSGVKGTSEQIIDPELKHKDIYGLIKPIVKSA